MKLTLIGLLVALFASTGYAEEWWQHEVFYQIYPRSFLDSNNDGIGDLPGIRRKLDHLRDAGINATWLSPIFDSPMIDFGYDISNFTKIYPVFGTMEDFEALSKRAKELGIKLILDFVPNHTSNESIWFQLSRNRTKGYEDYYVWVDGKIVNGTRQPPNNWLSNFGKGAWSWDDVRQQWYLHQFGVFQPDLNYRNPKVVEEMKNVLRFWLDRNVSGFRIDAVPFLFESEDLKDEPRSFDPNAQEQDYSYLNHIYTNNLPETYDMVYQWRALLDEYSKKDNISRIMMTEAYADIKHQIEYYGNETSDGAHFTFNFILITDLNENSTAHDFAATIYRWLSYLPQKYTSNWVLGNHDNHRFTSRYHKELADGLNMLLMILPGVAVTYYGDEIGMTDGYISWNETVDPQGQIAGPDRYQLFSRDPERTPFQWDDSKFAGFTNGSKPWLPVADNYKTVNLAAENKPGVDSHYNVYKDLIQLRKQATLKYGETNVKALSEYTLTVHRSLPGNDSYVLALNLGSKAVTIDLRAFQTLPDNLIVAAASVGSTYKKGNAIKTASVNLKAFEAYIFKSNS